MAKIKTAARPDKGVSQNLEILRRFRKNRSAMIGLSIFLLICLLAIFADVITQYSNAITQVKDARLLPPSLEHLFGTDHLGRDMFARILHGSRYSISFALAVSACSLVVSVVLGGIAGYYGGNTDNVIMRALDVVMCIPGDLLALCIVAAFGTNLGNLLIALIIGQVPATTRIVRATIMGVSSADYIEAAQCHGARDARIIAKYIVPNAMGPIIVNATVNASRIIISVSSLSFLGLGIQAPAPEWGNLLAGAREYMRICPWLVYFPGIALVVTSLSINMVGDGLRDALDPKIRD